MRYSFNIFVILLLFIPSKLYSIIISLRNLFYDRKLFTIYNPERPVISVGNITVGGTGKTPFVSLLCRHFSLQGKKIGVVSRGYGGNKSSNDVLIVSDGKGRIFAGARECGDEPFLLATSLIDVPVLVSKKRSKAIHEALHLFNPDIIVLDDGYQHRAVSRDANILLIDATDPFGNYRLLPSGILREPIQNIKRADIVIITRAEKDEEFITLERIIKIHNGKARIFKSGHVFSELVMSEGSKTLKPSELSGKKVYAFCAIGNPDVFILDIEKLGAKVVGSRFFRDHHRYSQDDIKSLVDDALSASAEMLVTTHKDIINMGPIGSLQLPLYYARIQAVVHESEQFFAALEEMLAKRRSER